MRFSESWLREWVNPSLTTAELDNVLTMGGLEVEEATPAAPAPLGPGAAVAAHKHLPNRSLALACRGGILRGFATSCLPRSPP